ncbi:MAG TPA: L,D-transpeptidase family protein [Allosphingosinicella sp.]|nr:L,D-transpeptidase family protein [Allosphingosinicella sp.]
MRLRLMFAAIAATVLAIGGLCAFSLARPPVRGRVVAATDHILVDKSDHRMTLFKRGRIIKSYRVALGRGGLGPKTRAGDNKVPEGLYRITGHNPDSAYHLSLRIGYPTAMQASNARKRGVDPGGDIMIHGIRNGLGWIGGQHRRLDWTRGCIGVTDDEIEEIWRLVPDQTPIEIRA